MQCRLTLRFGAMTLVIAFFVIGFAVACNDLSLDSGGTNSETHQITGSDESIDMPTPTLPLVGTATVAMNSPLPTESLLPTVTDKPISASTPTSAILATSTAIGTPISGVTPAVTYKQTPTQTLTFTRTAEDDASSFPLRLYDVPVEDLPVVAAAGFQAVHLYDSRQTLTSAIRYLEAAEEAGLQVIQNMPSAYLHDGDEFWIEWVSTLAAYDNLVWWYLPEEPRITDQETMERLYEIVREYDTSRRPAAIYFGTTHLERWCNVSDIMLLPAYPEYHKAPRAVARAWLDIARDACPGKTVVSVQTLFDTNFDGTGDRPTPTEARSDAYTAIIAGSQGLAWYSYSRSKDLPELWSAIQEVAREIEILAPVIAAPALSQTIRPQILSGPNYSPDFEGHSYDSIQTLQKTRVGAIYILSVNLAEAPVMVQFEGLPEDATEVNVLFEERILPIVDKAFRDEFQPAAVHIYMIVPR